MKRDQIRQSSDLLATRRSLIERAKLGDQAAWTVLYERYVNLIRSQIAKRNVPKNEIDDVAQDVLTRLSSKALQQFGWRSMFRSFLWKCVRNTCADWFEGKNRRKGFSTDDAVTDDLPDRSTPEPDAAFDRAFDLSTVESAEASVRADFETRGEAELFDSLLACMDKSLRELRAETARHFRLSEKAIRTRISRLRKDIQDALRQHMHDVIPDPAEANAEYERLVRPYVG